MINKRRANANKQVLSCIFISRREYEEISVNDIGVYYF